MATIQTHTTQTEATRKYGIVDMPDLTYTPELAEETASLYEKVSSVIPPIERSRSS